MSRPTSNKNTFSYERMDKAFNVIDSIEDPLNNEWFLTKEDLESKIKLNINKYFEFCLYILEKFEAVTKDEKEVKNELNKLINSIEMEDAI